MAKKVFNNEVANEVNFILTRLRNYMVYEGKTKAPIYLAGIHKQTFETIAKMGINFDKAHHTINVHAPKKGTKAYKELFKGVDLKGMLAKAKEFAKAAEKAAKVAKTTAAPKAKKVAAKKTAEPKAAAKAEPKAKATKKTTEKKVAEPKAKVEKKAAEKKVEPKATKKVAEKKVATPKAKVEKKTAAPKAEKKVEVAAESK